VNNAEQEIVKQKVRRVVGINALRKIGLIVATDRQTDNEKAKMLRWFARYGWIVLPGVALLVAYAMGLI
jgi:hypothetical protein